jgi:hypothetical protein
VKSSTSFFAHQPHHQPPPHQPHETGIFGTVTLAIQLLISFIEGALNVHIFVLQAFD